MTKLALIVDTDNLAHRAAHVYSELGVKLSINGKLRFVRTGMIYGVIKQLITLNERFGPDRMEVVWGDGHDLRSDIYPEYKEGRVKTNDFRIELKATFKCLKALGLRQRKAKGVEADDVIAGLEAVYRDAEYKVVIASPDKDFKQLLRPGTKLWRQVGRQARLYDMTDFRAEYDRLTPRYYAHLQALTGDGVDNIPGIRGVGDAKALKIMSYYQKPTIKNILNNVFLIKDKTLQDMVIGASEQLKTYIRLTKLRRDIVPKLTYKPGFKKEDAIAALNRYRMASFTFPQNFTKIEELPR